MSQSVVEFVRPTPDHIDFIAATMREFDAVEVMASNGHTPHEAISHSVRDSHFAVTAVIDKIPCAIFGLAVHDILTGTGAPWMLGSDELLNYGSLIVKHSREVVEEMNQVCPKLMNYVHAENKTSINWLRRIGFTIHPATAYGVGGELFHPFTKVRSDHV